MDTTYVGIMLVVFLVVAALAIDIGYMYVSEDDLRNMAELSALEGSRAMKRSMLDELRTDPTRLEKMMNDPIQPAARSAATEHAAGKNTAVSLMEIRNGNINRFAENNDLTVGFWNVSTQVYTPGGTPVNAVQVRTRRTAESESVGLGSMGAFLAKISGIENFNYTPEAIVALPPKAKANFALCADACRSECVFPSICSLPDRKFVHDPSPPGSGSQSENRYAFTSLMYHATETMKLSDMICMDLPAQEVCGKQIGTIFDRDENALRDLESMMYNPNVDASNKEFDPATGSVKGWWVIAPVTACQAARQSELFEQQTVTKYALVRISKICVPGATGCKQNNTTFDSPTAVCGGETGLYIDRISCVSCGSKTMLGFPGLYPVQVK